MPLCGSMLSTNVFQKNMNFLVVSLKVNNLFNNCILMLQIQSNESLHKHENKMCRHILISCKEKNELIEEICKPYFWTEVVDIYLIAEPSHCIQDILKSV